MPKVQVPYSPVGGVAYGNTPHKIGESQVQKAVNWCFDGRRAWTRPGLASGTTDYQLYTGLGVTYQDPTSPVVIAGSVFCSQYYGPEEPTKAIYGPQLFMCSSTELYVGYLNSTMWACEPAGVDVIEFSDYAYGNWALINGQDLVIANCKNGLIYLVVGEGETLGGQYQIITTAKYAYVTSHYSRCIAANAVPGAGFKQTVAWCVPGDVTDWTSTLDGAGSTVLTDAPDDITGIAVVRNTVVVARRFGFHLGYPTGVSDPAYRFEMFSRDEVGCAYEESLATSAEAVFFVGIDNVYMFDLNRVIPIGDDIKELLFEEVSTETWTHINYRPFGTRLIGFISRVGENGEPPRTLYNIVVINSDADTASRHYAFDIGKGTWEVHDYDFKPGYAFPVHTAAARQSIALYDQETVPELSYWKATVPCEREAILVGRNMTVGSEIEDVRLDRVCLKYQDLGEATATFTARSEINSTEVSATEQVNVGTPGRTKKWSRKWINGLSQAGQGWEWEIRTQPNSALAVSDIVATFSRNSTFRDE